MTAELQPQIEFAMMGQQQCISSFVNEKGRTGEVSRNAGAFEAIVVLLYERFKAVDDFSFLRVPGAVVFEELQKGTAMHLFRSKEQGANRNPQ